MTVGARFCYRVELSPIDPLLFGDNRSARAGLDHWMRDQDLAPHTLFGAVGQFIASRAASWPEDTLGPRKDDVFGVDPASIAGLHGWAHHHEGRLWFPLPKHLRVRWVAATRAFRPIEMLVPREEPSFLTANRDPGRRYLVAGQDEDEYEGDLLVDEHVLRQVLAGACPSAITGHVLRPGDVFRRESRPGIMLSPVSGVAADGMLFTRPYRRFRPAEADGTSAAAGSGITAWYSTPGEIRHPDPDVPKIASLGGDGGRVRIEMVRESAQEWALPIARDRIESASLDDRNGGFVAYLATPMIAAAKPPILLGMSPLAAAIGKPTYVSGWDVAKGRPRPLRTLVPAGSTYFYPWPNDIARDDVIRRLWLASAAPEGAAVGYGRILPGVWRCA